MPKVPASIAEAVEKGTQLSRLRKDGLATQTLMFMLAELSMVFDIEWSDEKLELMVKKIIEKFWHLKIEEVAYVFSLSETGYYGKVSWKGLRVADVISWLHKYDTEDRQDYIESGQHRDGGRPFEEMDARKNHRMRDMEEKMIEKFSAVEYAKQKVNKDKPT